MDPAKRHPILFRMRLPLGKAPIEIPTSSEESYGIRRESNPFLMRKPAARLLFHFVPIARSAQSRQCVSDHRFESVSWR